MEEQKKNKQNERQVRIEIDNTVADGQYANLAFIASNNSEVIVDFARFLPGNSRGKVVSRIIMAPNNAKNFLNSMKDSIDRYEKKFGTISVEENTKNIGFKINQENSEEK